MNLIKKNLFLVMIVSFLIVFPILTLAGEVDGEPCDVSGKICNPINVNSINDFIKKILEGVIKIGIPIIALAIIY
ncbi:MAG: hypothetical protein AAB943_00090, partial [Patescibacteria group bacterium]